MNYKQKINLKFSLSLSHENKKVNLVNKNS